MILLIRDEIQSVFEEVDLELEKYIIKLLEVCDVNNYPIVSLTTRNAKVVDIEDDKEIVDYLHFLKVDSDKTLLVTTLISSGVIHTMQGYAQKLTDMITEE